MIKLSANLKSSLPTPADPTSHFPVALCTQRDWPRARRIKKESKEEEWHAMLQMSISYRQICTLLQGASLIALSLPCILKVLPQTQIIMHKMLEFTQPRVGFIHPAPHVSMRLVRQGEEAGRQASPIMIDRGVERAEEVFGRWKEEEEGEEFLECACSLAAGKTDERRPGAAICDTRTI